MFDTSQDFIQVWNDMKVSNEVDFGSLKHCLARPIHKYNLRVAILKSGEDPAESYSIKLQIPLNIS